MSKPVECNRKVFPKFKKIVKQLDLQSRKMRIDVKMQETKSTQLQIQDKDSY